MAESTGKKTCGPWDKAFLFCFFGQIAIVVVWKTAIMCNWQRIWITENYQLNIAVFLKMIFLKKADIRTNGKYLRSWVQLCQNLSLNKLSKKCYVSWQELLAIKISGRSEMLFWQSSALSSAVIYQLLFSYQLGTLGRKKEEKKSDYSSSIWLSFGPFFKKTPQKTGSTFVFLKLFETFTWDLGYFLMVYTWHGISVFQDLSEMRTPSVSPC